MIDLIQQLFKITEANYIAHLTREKYTTKANQTDT